MPRWETESKQERAAQRKDAGLQGTSKGHNSKKVTSIVSQVSPGALSNPRLEEGSAGRGFLQISGRRRHNLPWAGPSGEHQTQDIL